MERAEITAFFLTSFALAGVKILLTFIITEYAIALLTMMGKRIAQKSSQYHLQFRTYAARKKSSYLLISVSKKILRIKKGT